MTNPLKSERSTNLGLLLARLPMGAFFLIAGYQKVFKIGVDNFIGFASRYGSAPKGIPADWVHTYLHAIPFMELGVGLALVLGLFGRLGGFIGALMVLSFEIGFTGLHGNNPNDQALPFHPNLIYVGLLLMLLFVGPGRISLDGLIFGRGRSAKA